MDQRDGDALLIERPAHVAVHRNDTDAADSAGAGQDDPVGLGGEGVSGREGVIGDKGLHRLLRPGGPDTIREVKSSRHFAAEAVDIEGDAAGIIATAPAAGAKESPIVAAAKKSAAASR